MDCLEGYHNEKLLLFVCILIKNSEIVIKFTYHWRTEAVIGIGFRCLFFAFRFPEKKYIYKLIKKI